MTDQTTVKHITWLGGHQNQMNCVLSYGQGGTLIDNYFSVLKSVAAADGSVLLPRDIRHSNVPGMTHFIKKRCRVKL